MSTDAQEVRPLRRKPTTTGSTLNALDYLIGMGIHNAVNTALPVIVEGVQAGGPTGPAGYVDARPLITQIDAYGNAVPPSTIYRLPYFRLQAGTAAIVLDPFVGDIGLAVFAQRDCSTLTTGATAPVQPGSTREYDQADGFYVGGFINRAPSTSIELRQNGEIHITASKVVVSGDLIASGISVAHHRHPGDSGGTTGEPIA